LTERRTTITVGWRPAGAPARRVDDFLEVAAEPEPLQQQPERRVERRNISRRLENWGAWATSRGSRGADCMTGLVCESARRAALGDVWSGHEVRDRIDARDAERIQAAIPKISQDQRWVLNWTYVEGQKESVVAAACGFPLREYAQRLVDAQAAIESVVNEITNRKG
jgi:DNA-directed RNA polymerase specialized sigma24 family protein